MGGQAGGSILIVEDDVDLLRVYTRILRQVGHEVTEASNGPAALELVRSRAFEAVLSDVAMPQMDGIQVLRHIRAHDLDVPVILITAGPTIEGAMLAVEHGAFRYLQKPVPLETLTKLVSDAVGLCRMARLKRQVIEESGTLTRQIGDIAGLTVKFASALEKLWIAYQPIVCWSRRTVHAYEALVRSREPAIPHPGALFETAERLGQVHQLGRAIRSAAPAPMGGTDALLFVNLSTAELMDDDLFSADTTLARTADRTVLEITERASLDEIKDVRQRIGTLRSMGFRIALDDIGAGYAGLSSFAALEPDVVKLDMSLVRDVQSSVTKQRLIRSMTTLCAEMGTVVVAEGVETTGELSALIGLGCDYFQGYYFAKPAPAFTPVHWGELAAA